MNTRPRISHFPFFSAPQPISLFGRSIHRVYQVFIEPRSATEDTRRQEFILNTILCCIIPLLVFLDAIVLLYNTEQVHYKGIPFSIFSGIVLVFMYLLLLSRKGYYKTAAWALLLLYFVSTTYGAIRWGAELPLVAISYIIMIVISSMIISTQFALAFTGVIAVTIIAITWLQLDNVLHPLLAWKHTSIRLSDSFDLTVIFFLITGVSWLSNRETERSLQRARSSEQALLEERDLLEIKVEERTIELKKLQQAKMAQLYRFAEFGKNTSGIFHDLMNTLQSVVLNVSQLEHSADQVQETKRYVEKAVSASKRLGNSIDAVRKHIADDNSHVAFSLEKEIIDAMEMLNFRAREAGVVCTLVVENSVVVHGNAVKFYQIILNLLSNAIDACEHTGNHDTITITLSSDEHTVTIVIADTGCGISPDNLATIFTEFFTTKPYTKGIGLGLSQTKEFVEQEFNGTIMVTSTERVGTTFIISFPFIPPHEDITTADLQ